MPNDLTEKSLLLIGASRGLGYAMAETYLKRGWHVVATERPGAHSPLHDLVARSDGRLAVATVDVNEPEQVATLKERLSGMTFELLFVNAGIKNDDRETIGSTVFSSPTPSAPCASSRATASSWRPRAPSA